MKITTIILSACALGASALLASAQDEKKEPAPPPPGRPMSPIVMALDANKDGVIDAAEIANAAAALKTLDKNGDGKLTADEIRPPRGDRGPGGRGPGGGGRPGGGAAGASAEKK